MHRCKGKQEGSRRRKEGYEDKRHKRAEEGGKKAMKIRGLVGYERERMSAVKSLIAFCSPFSAIYQPSLTLFIIGGMYE
ncbi:hypothetical protein KAX97_07480 [candidate division WOR-3 bacterium]|nr:hypothetical protein [candidate division WOR-3 bacterium]